MNRFTGKSATRQPRFGLARVLSKQGICSRSDATRWIEAGRVSVDGRVVRDPEYPIVPGQRNIVIDGRDIAESTPAQRRYLMLNKPRGLVTSLRDEQGRDTVYRCFDGAMIDGKALGWIAPVGRLDKASEGLLLFSNDPQWAARITDPVHGPDKTYHVQVDVIPDTVALAKMMTGIVHEGERLCVKSVTLLRVGEKNAWLEIVLDEGKNRQIRRLLAAFGINVLRLVRVAIGELQLGELGKGHWRELRTDEVQSLALRIE